MSSLEQGVGTTQLSPDEKNVLLAFRDSDLDPAVESPLDLGEKSQYLIVESFAVRILEAASARRALDEGNGSPRRPPNGCRELPADVRARSSA